MLMGIADLIPGVSGGTIALITGVYKDLISALNNISLKNIFKDLLKNFKSNKFDFLSVLGLGIILSIILFSKLILFLLENYNNQISSFFFGLIICSVYVLLKKVKPIKILDIILLLFFHRRLSERIGQVCIPYAKLNPRAHANLTSISLHSHSPCVLTRSATLCTSGQGPSV